VISSTEETLKRKKKCKKKRSVGIERDDGGNEEHDVRGINRMQGSGRWRKERRRGI
jgi:hypothetical protein